MFNEKNQDQEEEVIQQEEVYQPDHQPGNVQQYYHDNSNTARLLLNTEPFLERLRHRLLRETKKVDEDGKVYWEKPKGVKPLLSNEGLEELMVEVESFVNEITASGIYTDDEIRVKVLWAAKTVIEWIAKNHGKYQIDYDKSGSLIVLTVEQTVDAILRKAKNGATLETVGDMNKIREMQTNTLQQEVQPQRRGFQFNPFGMMR